MCSLFTKSVFTTLLIITVRALAAQRPLTLPDDYDSDVHMLGSEVEGKVFHYVYRNAQFVGQLLANGTKQDVQLAEAIIDGLLLCQDTIPQSPNYGGFRWELETPLVDDLNAVEFLLDGLIPMMIKDGHLLSDSTDRQLRESIRLALHNVDRVDVAFDYTNIVLKDIVNSCLGGELLKDADIAERGYRRLREWVAYTDSLGGTAYEYNAIPYAAVALDVLSKLERLVQDEDTRVLAKIMLGRLAISAGLHIHKPTGRWAGPHGRAYHASYISKGGWYILKEAEMETLLDWVEEGKLPSWVAAVISGDLLPDQLIETVSEPQGMSISTYKTDGYAFGVASRNLYDQDNRWIAWQSNVFSLVFKKPKSDLPGIVYSRYINNDEWLGDFSAAPGRPHDMLIPDKGHFQGIQQGNRAIGLYAPRQLNALDHYESAKSVIALPRWDNDFDKCWINEQEVEDFPATVEADDVVVFQSGTVLIGIRPFQLGNLGYGSHMEVREMEDRDHTLVLEMYNYQGPPKTFWELSWPGAFFQGWPTNGWYAEVVDVEQYADGGAFAAEIAQGEVLDQVDKPFTYTGTEDRRWRVQYSRGDRLLGMEVDLFNWFEVPRRWDQHGLIGYPMLSSNFASQNRDGHVSVGDVQLTCAKGPAWLFVSPDKKTIVAAYHGPASGSLLLAAGSSKVQLDHVSRALVVIEDGIVEIDAIGLVGEVHLDGLKLKK